MLEDPFPFHNDRGWLLHFSADLSEQKTPGDFGWDDTASVVDASLVKSYHGASMKEVLTITGPTPDPSFSFIPGAVRERCINTAAVDPFTKSVPANSEDGKLYRWDLTTNSFSQVITLTGSLGEAYTPTVIGSDGTVYEINDTVLFAVEQKGGD